MAPSGAGVEVVARAVCGVRAFYLDIGEDGRLAAVTTEVVLNTRPDWTTVLDRGDGIEIEKGGLSATVKLSEHSGTKGALLWVEKRALCVFYKGYRRGEEVVYSGGLDPLMEGHTAVFEFLPAPLDMGEQAEMQVKKMLIPEVTVTEYEGEYEGPHDILISTAGEAVAETDREPSEQNNGEHRNVQIPTVEEIAPKMDVEPENVPAPEEDAEADRDTASVDIEITIEGPTLEDFCTAMGTEMLEGFTFRDALVALIGQANFDCFTFNAEPITALLSWPANTALSAVDFSRHCPVFSITEALIRPLLPSDQDWILLYGNDEIPVLAADLSLTWTPGGDITITSTIHLADDCTLTDVHSIASVPLTTSLETYLLSCGLRGPAVSETHVLDALSLFTHHALPEGEIVKLTATLATFAHLLNLHPDLSASTVDAALTPTGVVIKAVHLFLPPLESGFPDVTIGAAGISVEHVALDITDPALPSRDLALSIRGALRGADGVRLPIKLEPRYQGSQMTGLAVYIDGGSSSLADVIAAFEPKSQALEARVPFEDKSVGRLGGVTGVGFLLEKEGEGPACTRVWAFVGETGWKGHLPPRIEEGIETGEMRVEILQPFDDDARAVAAHVQLAVKLGENPVRLAMEMSAEWSATADTGAYRLAVTSTSGPTGFFDLWAALGFSDKVRGLVAGVPVLEGLLRDVHVRALKLDMAQVGQAWEVESWRASVASDVLELISGTARVRGLALEVQSVRGTVLCDARGELEVEAGGKMVYLPVLMPNFGKTVTLEILDPRGLSPAALMGGLGLKTDGIVGLPIVGGLLDIPLTMASLSFGAASLSKPHLSAPEVSAPGISSPVLASPEVSSPDIFIPDFPLPSSSTGTLSLPALPTSIATLHSATLTLQKAAVTIGPIPLTDLEASLIISPTLNSYTARIRASLASLYLAASATYTSNDNSILVALRPRTLISVTTLLAKLLDRELPEQLVALLAPLKVQGAEATLDAETWEVKAFNIDVPEAEGINLGVFKLRAPRIKFTGPVNGSGSSNGSVASGPDAPDGAAGVLSQNKPSVEVPAVGVPGIDTDKMGSVLELLGTLGSETAKSRVRIGFPLAAGVDTKLLSLAIHPETDGALSVLSLLKSLKISTHNIKLPPGDFDMLVQKVIGQLEIQNTPGVELPRLDIHSLDVVGESAKTIQLFTKGNINLDKLTLDASFVRGHDLVATIKGRLRIATSELWLSFGSDADGEHYAGVFGVESLDMHDLIRSLALPSTFFDALAGLGLPSTLPLNTIDAKFTKDRALEIHATGKSVWDATCGGVPFKLSNIGAHIKHLATMDALEVCLTGSLALPGGLVAQFRLEVNPRGHTVLVGRVEATQGGSVEVTALADVFGAKGTWSTILPASSTPLGFAAPTLAVYADFTAEQVALLGALPGHGEAVILTKPDPATGEHGFALSLTTDNLGGLWPRLAPLGVRDAAVHVVALETTLAGLQADIGKLGLSGVGPERTQRVMDAMAGFVDLPPDMRLARGAWFFARLALDGESPLARSLRLGVKTGSVPRVTAFALVSEEVDSVVEVDVRGLELLSGNMAFDGRGTYCPAQDMLAVQGTLVLSGLVKEPLAFDVDLYVKPGGTTFSAWRPEGLLDGGEAGQGLPSSEAADGKRPDAVEKSGINGPTKQNGSPLKPSTNGSATSTAAQATRRAPPAIKGLFNGKMFNVSLTAPSFRGSILTANGTITQTHILSGRLQLGSIDSASGPLGALTFFEGQPKLLTATFDHPLPITDLFSALLASGPKSPTWPSGFPSLTLETARLYYYTDSKPLSLEDFEYVPGYHVHARISLFDAPFTVQLDLPDSRDGIVLAGTYEDDLDLGFAQLLCPRLNIDTTGRKAVFGARAGVRAFGFAGEVQLTCTPGGASEGGEFAGKAKLTGSVFGVKNPEIPFTFSGDGFGLKDWGVARDGDGLLDLADAIMKGSEGDRSCSCGKLTGLVFEQVKTKFNFKLSFTAGRGKGVKVNVTARAAVAFDVSVKGKKVASIALGELSITVPAPFTKDALWTALGNAIKSSATEIGKTLLQHPQDLAAIIAVQSVSKYSNQLTSRLICRKVTPKNLLAHASSLAEAETSLLSSTALKALSVVTSVPISPSLPLSVGRRGPASGSADSTTDTVAWKETQGGRGAVQGGGSGPLNRAQVHRGCDCPLWATSYERRRR
ncbi:hypothetical protein EJ06DRAFT_164124 [Trichodelitschia bisporula]|uniref:Uncharacterized protein n=1 Tax=Trichodelitschia bisporula TaxID=703511 RepID=A0A6G1HN31_9PEZI|nr:hypothetical protein EJ06DRAFT_164124 [Trichodelitschia bisporula]